MFGPISRYRDYFDARLWPEFGDHFNIAPSLSAPVVRQSPEGGRVADLLRWGLIPNWAKDPVVGAKLNNARGETVAEKPSFRNAFQKRRCIVPAMGFYEWQARSTGKQPYYVSLKSGDPLAMAGLWESWRDPAGGIVRTFCIITVEPNALMQPIYGRMPMLLHPSDFARWLDPSVPGAAVLDLVRPYESDAMQAWTVSKAVGNASNDGAYLIGNVLQQEEGVSDRGRDVPPS